MNYQDEMKQAVRAYTSADGAGLKALTGTSSSITVTAFRTYELILIADSGFATIKVGDTAVAPTTGNVVSNSFNLVPGIPRLLRMDTGETAIHGIMAGGATSGTLVINRFP